MSPIGTGHRMAQGPIVQAFDRLRARTPHAKLIASPTKNATVSDIHDLASAVENQVEAAGLKEGSIVGLKSSNGPSFLAALLACRRVGAVALLVDEQATDQELTRINRHLGVAGVIECALPWPRLVGDVLVRATGCKALAPPSDDVAVIKMTSGSTGEPRGIAVTEESLLADDAALISSMGIRTTDRLLATVPFSHSYGLSSLVLPALVRGLPLVLPASGGALDPITAAFELEATVFPTVPAYLAGLARLPTRIELSSSLRLVISAGAPLPPETAVRFREQHGRFVHVFYGASECGGITYDREGRSGERGTLGHPIDGVQIQLEDRDGSGERVVVSSLAVAATYFPNSDPSLGDGRFVSGDVGRWTGGELSLVGRADDMINIRGKKINPKEIELVIADLEHVDEVKVVGAANPENGETILRAVVASRVGGLDWDCVRSWCRGRLSHYKIPRSIVFVDQLPRNNRGKIVLSELRRHPGPEDR